jgi:hypothetical protein
MWKSSLDFNNVRYGARILKITGRDYECEGLERFDRKLAKRMKEVVHAFDVRYSIKKRCLCICTMKPLRCILPAAASYMTPAAEYEKANTTSNTRRTEVSASR